MDRACSVPRLYEEICDISYVLFARAGMLRSQLKAKFISLNRGRSRVLQARWRRLLQRRRLRRRWIDRDRLRLVKSKDLIQPADTRSDRAPLRAEAVLLSANLSDQTSIVRWTLSALYTIIWRLNKHVGILELTSQSSCAKVESFRLACKSRYLKLSHLTRGFASRFQLGFAIKKN